MKEQHEQQNSTSGGGDDNRTRSLGVGKDCTRSVSGSKEGSRFFGGGEDSESAFFECGSNGAHQVSIKTRTKTQEAKRVNGRGKEVAA